MIDPTEHEIAAIQAGGISGGEYLDSIGKTDLAKMNKNEWLTMCEAIITGFQDELGRLAAKLDREILERAKR